MIIRSKSQLAIHALVDLAANESERPVTLASIAARQSISLSYLEQLFRRLRAAGLVRSTRGPGGGYRANRPLSAITVADIVLAVDDKSQDGNDCPETLGQVDCVTQGLWRRLDQFLYNFLTTVTLASIANCSRAAPDKTPGKSLAQGDDLATYKCRGQGVPAGRGWPFGDGMVAYAMSTSKLAARKAPRGQPAGVAIVNPDGMAGNCR